MLLLLRSKFQSDYLIRSVDGRAKRALPVDSQSNIQRQSCGGGHLFGGVGSWTRLTNRLIMLTRSVPPAPPPYVVVSLMRVVRPPSPPHLTRYVEVVHPTVYARLSQASRTSIGHIRIHKPRRAAGTDNARSYLASRPGCDLRSLAATHHHTRAYVVRRIIVPARR